MIKRQNEWQQNQPVYIRSGKLQKLSRQQTNTESFIGEVLYQCKSHLIEVTGFLWGALVQDRFPESYNVTIHGVASFYVQYTPEDWKPYDRGAHKTKKEWVEVEGEFIQAWYQ